MRNLYHDTGSVASLVASLSSAMFHVFQHLQCIVYQIVTLSAVDVYYHSHAASIVLVVALIESLILSLKFTFRHIILTFTITLLKFCRKGMAFCNHNTHSSDVFIYFLPKSNNL